MPDKPFRIAHLVTHPIQYFAPLYRAITALPGIGLTVFFYSDMGLTEFQDRDFGRTIRWDNDLTGGYHAVFPESGRGMRGRLGLGQMPSWDLLRQLKDGRFDAVWVHGYQHPNALLARVVCQLQGIPWLVREDQTLLEPRSWQAMTMKKMLGNLLFAGRRNGALFTGTASRAHFLEIGASPKRALRARHHVDDAFFSRQSRLLRPSRNAIRSEFGINDEAPVILFCGKFITKKQPLGLIEAFATVLAKRKCWLLMVGDGVLKPSAIERAESLKVADRVLFAGFLNQGQMPRAYAAADLFVLPSLAHETWGLVVNEAMHSGLPIVTSDHVGCAPDLLREGVNGYLHRAGDVAGLASALEKLLEDPERRRRFGLASLDIIHSFTTEQCARDIATACRRLAQRDDGRVPV